MTKMVQRALVCLTFFMVVLAKILLGQKLFRRKQGQKSTCTCTSGCCSCCSWSSEEEEEEEYGRRWRLAVEANNVDPWRTVPAGCYEHVQSYMVGGEYEKDLELITHRILHYALHIPLSPDGFDAWVFDVDDTCISNLSYYKSKRFGCDPFDSGKFKEWIMKGECPAIPAVLSLFKKLVKRGFKLFLLTGRDEATLGHITSYNLHTQGYVGYQRLILRSREYKGQGAAKYKSEIRKQIEGEGYRIWGNVGDQWSDLQGHSLGNHTFKLPNPMYFIP